MYMYICIYEYFDVICHVYITYMCHVENISLYVYVCMNIYLSNKSRLYHLHMSYIWIYVWIYGCKMSRSDHMHMLSRRPIALCMYVWIYTDVMSHVYVTYICHTYEYIYEYILMYYITFIAHTYIA